jgi:hypothetical protein
MKRIAWLGVISAMSFMISCGSSGGTTPVGDTVELSGQLGTGAIAAMTVDKAAVAASGYSVVAIANDSNKTYLATTDNSGNFTLDVPPDDTYLVTLLNDGSYVGPTVFSGSGTEVNTGIKPSANTDLGSITVDTTAGYARTATDSTEVDATVTAVAVGGVPVGSGNDGKVTQTGITNRVDSDEDKDGIPNIFDADENNDGFRTGVLTRPSGSAVASSYVETVYMSSNIWAEHSTTEPAEDIIAMRFHVVPIAGQESMLASVACTSVPAIIQDVAQVRWADSLGNPTGYPTENSLWKTSGYGLYQTTTMTPEEWIISIRPAALMSVGDTFSIQVTYTDSTTETFFVSMPYILIDWARVVSYNSTTMPTVAGSKTVPVIYDANTLTIEFSKPLDEDGNVLAGLTYSIVYGISDCSSGTCTVPATTTPLTVTDTGAATLSGTITTSTADTDWYVTPVAETPTNDQRNGEETWFHRQ